MVGKRLGKKEYDDAYMEARKIMYAGLTGSVFVSVLLILLAGVYTGLYRVDQNVKELGKILLVVFALYAPVKVENMILGGGIIRSGGNTRIIMIIDIVAVHSCSVCVPMGDCRCLYITYHGGNFQADRITCYFQETKMDDQFIITNRRGVENGKGCPDVTLLLDPIAKG